jgi:hydrophobe/amphiphile efflux-1 (HAE1) family protein
MSLSATSIRNPVFAWMLMFGLIVFGAIGFSRMGISNMPDVNFPVVNISLTLENAAPEVMEADVVDLIEDAVMGIEGLKSISSSTSQGRANVTCEFNQNRNIDIALQEVQQRIQQIQNTLPTQLYPPVISKTNPEDQPILWVMLTADEGVPLFEQMMYARNTLKNQLSTLEGVGTVLLAGYVDPNLRVWVDRTKLYNYELMAGDVTNAIQTEQTEQPAGRIEAPKTELNIRVLGETRSVPDFSALRINTRGGGINYNPIPLASVAKVEEGLADIRAISRYNGKTAVGLGIVKQHGSNAVKVADSIYQKVAQMQPALRKGYHLDVRLDQTKFIHESVRELNQTLIVAALLTSVICYLFLGSFSSTFNVLVSIPTSIVGAFIVLYFLGFTLNTFTLLGLSLAIGIVVDDAIMMLENIVRHAEMGKPKRLAALEGSEEITFAALATTLAIAAIFIPVVFMRGVVGAFFYQYGITVTVAVFLSLLEALTLTPMRCARFLTTAHGASGNALVKGMDALMHRLAGAYRRSLEVALSHRWAIVGASLAVFAASLMLVSTLNKELIPAQDQSLFLLNIKTPVGTSITATDDVFRQAERYLSSEPNVKEYYTTIGNYEQNNVVNAGTLYVVLKDASERKLSQRELMEKIRREMLAELPGADVFAQDLSLTGFSASRGYPVEFTLQGPDWDKLQDLSVPFLAKLRESGLVEDVNMDFQMGMPEIVVVPDRLRASEKGVTISSMETEVNALIGGQIFNANTQYPHEDHRYYIRVRSERDQHATAEDINRIRIRNNRGEMVQLSDVSKIESTHAPQLISRFNRARAIPVFANVAKGKSQQAALDRVEAIGRELLPPGYHVVIGGSGNAFREAFDGLVFAILLGIIVAYMILASQFNSFLHPVTVLMALPFSLSGALLALWITGQSLSLFSMIGLILLMGIVKKNSILLVDFTNQRRREGGLSAHDALLEACPVRLRPILMTSIAIVAGAIPEAVNFGAGAETRIPMAVSLIGGVTVSTFLTLYVVPCVYSIFVSLERPEKEELPAPRLEALKTPAARAEHP